MPQGSTGSTLPNSLRALGASLLGLVCARAELIGVELRQEKARAQRRLLLLVLGAMFLFAAVLLAALLVVVLFWDTHRIAAAAGVVLLCLGIGAFMLGRLQAMDRDSEPPFAATIAEFENDLKVLRRTHE